MSLDAILDRGYLPHFLIRMGIRWNCRERLNRIRSETLTKAVAKKMAWIEGSKTKPIAIETAKANEQHYEVGTDLLAGTLGPRMKYSCCLYPTGKESLVEAEVVMLQSYVEKADLKDGMSILDLGCGWGSGALYYAQVLPNARVTAFSNSRTQKEYIDSQAAAKGFRNLTVITGNAADYEFDPAGYDRVVSIEMFEHMKNHEQLMAKVSRSLKPGGKLFVHMFAHRDTPYDFEEGWMTTHFFTGGTMPSADLLLYYQKHLKIQSHWWLNGMHYSRTCEHWLKNMMASKAEIWPSLEETYGKDEASTWYNRWQVFYLACSELFAFDGGDTWGVVHLLFEKPAKTA